MTCPTCGKPAEQRYRPFCSRRCSDVDLTRWLTGAYVLPGPEVEDDSVNLDRPDTDGRPS
ncbi:DNA gyrase inhibitor YacG [bacterium]|nr:DNA gyrase inhibitor YacG [bacterium]